MSHVRLDDCWPLFVIVPVVTPFPVPVVGEVLTQNGWLPEILNESLSQLKNDHIEIWPQTMPPYPWHFGGQRYQNLFIDPNEILSFCNDNGIRICHDISHSHLACNKFNLDHV